ncbi:uncharacterized protein [Prorops nasuta]|uniref:uncharacterized protein n=1 Tax=Prorops nasuta TaxID=863751 RepID=UPI0034CE090B
MANVQSEQRYSLLPTVEVIVVSLSGQLTHARALLDQGSETTFISESLVQSLRLVRQRVHVPIVGVGSSKGTIARFCVSVRLKSGFEKDFEIDADALVLIRPTGCLPTRVLSGLDLTLISKLHWADPRFYLPNEIDMILGVDIYAIAIRRGLQNVGMNELIAQQTAFGWIFSGQILQHNGAPSVEAFKVPRVVMHSSEKEDLCEILKRFWSIEEVPESQRKLSPDNELCEHLFVTTHSRNESGRYVVSLPLKTEPPSVAESTRRLALNSLAALKRRFNRNPELASAYHTFMRDYEGLGHMQLIPEDELVSKRAWYLPHHAVVQPGISKSKIRVVFDASRRTADQHCLNNFLLAGPSLQQDLPLILLNWRQYSFVFTADIVKMFRQIIVADRDQDLQRILWSPTPEEAPRDYRLTTVTYGTTSAPYLAIRTLIQLASDEGHRYPLGAHCLTNQTYVDDVFSGANNLDDAMKIRDQLIDILHSAGIKLDKWAANNPELLPGISNIDQGKIIDVDKTVKTLGLLWQPLNDSFSFNTRCLYDSSKEMTKRAVLSFLARLFDPLGWLAPIIVRAKILIQDLWIMKIEWDVPLTDDLMKRWRGYCGNIEGVNEISVSRWLGPISTAKLELHGFADASMRAYAATVYIRAVNDKGECWVKLIIAKSKVAPVKTVSIPNLELCGAVLLVKLLKYVQRLDIFKDLPITAWSDSRDALAWIRKHPSNWKVFVANRVSYIQTELPLAVWKYVPSRENPADLATRGIEVGMLTNSKLWWAGPTWLGASEEHWPVQPIYTSPSEQGELERARKSIIQIVQSVAFKDELISLKANRPLTKRSRLYNLRPFLDDQGIIRVGGRLTHSALTFPAKHPPIPPKTSSLSQLYIHYAHRLALHAGPTLTLGVLMNQVWVIGASGLVKRLVRACIRCFRTRPRPGSQRMGDLPPSRVTPSRPFTTTGLDYAGPFKLKFSKGRGQRTFKGYIALFVCFSTKAIHLEAVGDLTTQSFLAALRRFTSRRGICHRIVSDNGTNFQGADRELRNLFKVTSEFYTTIARDLVDQGITWEFIPPNSPHFGGLWEAGVKATKHHLVRVIGEYTLTFEEFATVLAEIEACLNSRPLCPLSGDIEDLRVLTPSHFLLGGTSGLIPDLPLHEIPENRLNRFQLLTRLQQDFWKRWSREYLHHLQQRVKWRDSTENYAIGQLVVVQDDRYPPAKWPLGRIIETHQGEDGLVRVVTDKTASTILKRPVVRLSPLPLPKS